MEKVNITTGVGWAQGLCVGEGLFFHTPRFGVLTEDLFKAIRDLFLVNFPRYVSRTGL